MRPSLSLTINHRRNMASIYQTQSNFCIVIFNIKETNKQKKKLKEGKRIVRQEIGQAILREMSRFSAHWLAENQTY